MNPTHDSLDSLVSYFSFYAERFLGLTNIGWKLEETPASDTCKLDSRRRHELFLAFKEALTNVVRHSGATQVRLGIHARNGDLQVIIADNGRGLPGGIQGQGMDGVANMKARVESLGGQFDIASENGH